MKAAMIALKASTLVASDRAKAHGDAARTYALAAALIDTYRKGRRDPNAPLSASDLMKEMVLVKLARSENGEFNNDDFIDMAGYAAIAGELEGRGL